MALKDLVTRIRITAKDETTAVFSSLQKRVAGIATAIAGYFSARMFGDSVRSAEELDVQMRKLEATIAATGGVAGLTAKEIDDMARRLDEATLGSAAGFRDAANALLTFKNVGRDSFETVLGLAADLEAAGFGNLEANAVQLGKALENPVKGLTALTRAGVSFSDEQQRVIRDLVETGRAAEAQGVILDAVAGQVGGVAAAAAGGLSGLRDLVGSLITDVQELFGSRLLPALERLQTRLASMLRTLRDSGAVERLGDAVAYVIDRAGRLVTLVTIAIGVRAVAALRAFTTATVTSTVAVGAKTKAVGLLTLAMNGLAAAGARATAAMVALGRATPILALGAAVAWLAGKFADAKTQADETAEAVAEVGEKAAEHVAKAAANAEVLRFRLSEVQEQFQGLTAEGKTAAEAVAAIASAADIGMSDGIAQMLNDLAELKSSAFATGEQIEEALVNRLAKLSARELREFGVQAEMAFGRGEIAAEQFATAMQARVRAAARQLGVDLDASLASGVSAAFAGALSNLEILREGFDDLKAAGVDAGAVLEQSLAAAIQRAANPAEFEALISAVQHLGREGRLSGDMVEQKVAAIRARFDELTPGINSAAEALKKLGIQSDADLRATAASTKAAYEAVVEMGGSLREQREAWRRYADAAIAANDGVADAALKAQAAQRGFVIEATAAGDRIASGLAAGDKALKDTADQAERTRRAIESIGDEAERTGERIAKSARPFGGDSGFNNAADVGSAFWSGQSRIGGTTGALERELRAAATSAGRR